MAELNSTIVKGNLNTTGYIYENGTRVLTSAPNYYPSRSYSSGLQISTSQGVTNTCALYVPNANGTTQAGIVSTGAQTFGGAKTFSNVYINTDGGFGFYDGSSFKKAVFAGSELRPQYRTGTGPARDLAMLADIPTVIPEGIVRSYVGFYTSPYYKRLDGECNVLETITTNIASIPSSAAAKWGTLYEYFRGTIFHLSPYGESDTPLSNYSGSNVAIGLFTPGTSAGGQSEEDDCWISDNLAAYFEESGMGQRGNLDSFKVEALGGAKSEAECTLKITLYDKSAYEYTLQIYCTYGTDASTSTYTTTGWKKTPSHSLYEHNITIIQQYTSNVWGTFTLKLINDYKSAITTTGSLWTQLKNAGYYYDSDALYPSSATNIMPATGFSSTDTISGIIALKTSPNIAVIKKSNTVTSLSVSAAYGLITSITGLSYNPTITVRDLVRIL